MLCQNKENLFEVPLNHSCCYIYFPIPVCLCSGLFSLDYRIFWSVSFYYFFYSIFNFHPNRWWNILLLGSVLSSVCCVVVWGFFSFFFSFLESLLRIFNIHFLLLCLIPLLTVICPWLIILLHSFLGVCILHVLTDGYQIPILLSQSV